MHAARTLAADLAGAIRSPKKSGGELSGATGGGGIGAVRDRSRSRGCPGSPEGGWGYTKQGPASEMEVPATITPLVIPIQEDLS